MSVHNKKLSNSRISLCLFNLMLSTASLTIISPYTFVSEIQAMDMTEESILTDLYKIKDLPTEKMTFKPITFPIAKEFKEDQNFGHQVNACMEVATKIDNPTGSYLQIRYPECDLFNSFLVLANKKDSDFLSTMTQHMKERGNKIIKLIEDKNKSTKEENFSSLAPYLLLQLRILEDFVMKTHQLRTLRINLENQAEEKYKSLKLKAESDFKLIEVQNENHKQLNILTQHEKTKRELEAKKEQAIENIKGAAQNPTIQNWHKGELTKIESEIRINEENKKADILQMDIKLKEAKIAKDTQIAAAEAEKNETIQNLNYIYARIFEFKGASFIPGKKKLGRAMSGADTDRTKYTEYSILDTCIIEANRQGTDIVAISKAQVIKSWSDRYENDKESQRNKNALAKFFGYTDPNAKPVSEEQKEVKTEETRRNTRTSKAERSEKKERSTRRTARTQLNTSITSPAPTVEVKNEVLNTTTTSSDEASTTQTTITSNTPQTLAAEQMAIQDSITKEFVEKKKEGDPKPDLKQELTTTVNKIPPAKGSIGTSSYAAAVTTVPTTTATLSTADTRQASNPTPAQRAAASSANGNGKKNDQPIYRPNGARGGKRTGK